MSYVVYFIVEVDYYYVVVYYCCHTTFSERKQTAPDHASLRQTRWSGLKRLHSRSWNPKVCLRFVIRYLCVGIMCYVRLFVRLLFYVFLVGC